MNSLEPQEITNRDILYSDLLTYFLQMFGTDLSDQYLSYYHILRRSLKWTRKLAFHLFNLAVVNAFILWKKTQNEKKERNEQYEKIVADSHYRFRYNLAAQLLALGREYGAPTPRSRTNTSAAKESTARLTESGTHFPANNPATARRNKGSRKCHVCTQMDITKSTCYQCCICKVPLCVVPCFQIFHTEDYYTRPKDAGLQTFCKTKKRKRKQQANANVD